MLNALKRTLPLLSPAVREQWSLSTEADELESLYGDRAVEWCQHHIAKAPRSSRAWLYRLHDELCRRRSTYVRHH